MGRREWCWYCEARLLTAPGAARLHARGLQHQRLRAAHYQRHKDAETILAEESTKRPCLKFQRGECQFGALCRFSHYTSEQILMLQAQVAAKSRKREIPNAPHKDVYERLREKSEKQPAEDSTVLYNSTGHTLICPWTYPAHAEDIQDSLPPSLKKIKLEDFPEEDFAISEWG